MEPLRQLRSALGLFLALSTFPIAMLPFYLVFAPLAWLRPAWRPRLASIFMKGICVALNAAFRVGGARIRRHGRLPTDDPILVVANHQSLVDVVNVTLMGDPYVPAFVTRSRYARWIPLVAPCVRMLGCPIVDPRRDRRGAVGAVERGARELRHGLLIFPEGHRTPDGAVQPFKTAGMRAALDARLVPVYLVVSDGLWRARRLVDFIFNLHRMQGDVWVAGPLTPPEEPDRRDAFVASLRERLVSELETHRSAGSTR